jgi:hypothetical protein
MLNLNNLIHDSMIYDMTASVSAAAIRHVLVQSTGCLINVGIQSLTGLILQKLFSSEYTRFSVLSFTHVPLIPDIFW